VALIILLKMFKEYFLLKIKALSRSMHQIYLQTTQSILIGWWYEEGKCSCVLSVRDLEILSYLSVYHTTHFGGTLVTLHHIHKLLEEYKDWSL
jgi:hypothetical protein